MSKTSFLAQLGIAKMGKIGDAIVTSLVKFDPETASAAQIAEMGINCNQLAARVAQAETQVETDQKLLDQLHTSLDRAKQAAALLGERLAMNSDPSLETKLNTVLNEVEQIGGADGTGATDGRLFDAAQHLNESTADLAEWRETHQAAVTHLTTAKERLKKAHSEMEHAAHEQERNEERRRQAERDAGLKQGLDTTNVALSAMEQSATEAKKAARAAAIQTDALRQSSGKSADDIVNEALSNSKPATSALDRLAKLTQRT